MTRKGGFPSQGRRLLVLSCIVFPVSFGFKVASVAPAQQFGREISLADYGAVEGDPSANMTNRRAFNLALFHAAPGDTVVVPPGTWYLVGGVQTKRGHQHLTLDIRGNLSFVFDLDDWTYNPTSSSYAHCLQFQHMQHFTIKGPSVVGHGGAPQVSIFGNGKNWWDGVMANKISSGSRPRMLAIGNSSDVLVENLLLVDSPSWHLRISAARAEVRDVHVEVDRQAQAEIKARMAHKSPKLTSEFARVLPGRDSLILQPEDLNTDGIDASGVDIWIHDCVIHNDDDSVAVKPTEFGSQFIDGTSTNCTERVLVEDTILTGFGASIGSVGPGQGWPCVDSATFRNIAMPNTGKGIYIKSNKATCEDGEYSRISNILYENINIYRPRWWAIWIGPQQQHEPDSNLGGDCALSYPVVKHCPTQGCTDFSNIVLRDVLIEDPLLSPGVLLGNESNRMNVTFENVVTRMSDGGSPPTFPFDGYKVDHVNGVCVGVCDPFPEKFAQQD